MTADGVVTALCEITCITQSAGRFVAEDDERRLCSLCARPSTAAGTNGRRGDLCSLDRWL